MEYFVVFYSKDQRFYQRILEISKSSFTKLQICEIIFFFKIPGFTISFFYFFIIFNIFFSISCICTCQKILEIFMFFFILWIRDFVKYFWKIMERFSKKYIFEIQNSSKIPLLTICFFCFFLFFSIFGIFFLFHLIKFVKKF